MDFLSMFLNTAKILDLPVDFEKGAKIIGVEVPVLGQRPDKSGTMVNSNRAHRGAKIRPLTSV